MDKIIIISVQTWKLSVINNPPTFQLDKVIKKIKISIRIFSYFRYASNPYTRVSILLEHSASSKCTYIGQMWMYRWKGDSNLTLIFLWLLGGGGLVKQVMEFFQMENKYSQPNHKNFEDIDIKSSEEKKTLITGCCEWFYEVF